MYVAEGAKKISNKYNHAEGRHEDNHAGKAYPAAGTQGDMLTAEHDAEEGEEERQHQQWPEGCMETFSEYVSRAEGLVPVTETALRNATIILVVYFSSTIYNFCKNTNNFGTGEKKCFADTPSK